MNYDPRMGYDPRFQPQLPPISLAHRNDDQDVAMYGGLVYPGHGYPWRPGEGPATRAPGWARLCEGQAIGKKSVLLYSGGDEVRQRAPVPMLQIDGDDADATQMVITLAPPTVIPLPFVDVSGAFANQNVTGEQSNLQIRTRGNFPGTGAPIQWPPLEAIIEWGTGGTSARASVDFVNGLTLNISASFVRVFAAIASSARSSVIGTSAAYVLAAFASPGFASADQAQRTIYVGDVDETDESEVFSIPRFAKRAYLIGCDDGATPVLTVGTLRWWQSPDGTNNVGNLFVTGNQPQAFDVPNAAQYFSVISGMSGTHLFAVVFDLAL